MSITYPRSIEDNYSEYVDDEYGYHYHAWEVISASESRRHEEIRIGNIRRLDSLFENLSNLSDLESWALARRYLLEGDRKKYFAAVQPIVEGPRDHAAISYPEVFADVARHHGEDGNLAEARRLADEIGTHWPALLDALPILHAQIDLSSGDVESADEKFRATLSSPPDVDLLIEITEDFLDARAQEKAREWLEIATVRATEMSDSASLVDIELIHEQLDEPMSSKV